MLIFLMIVTNKKWKKTLPFFCYRANAVNCVIMRDATGDLIYSPIQQPCVTH